MTADPPFTQDFILEAVEGSTIRVRHKDGHWWRFDVAEKNGRRQLLHADHGAGPSAAGDASALGVDAYDTATLEARRRGMVD